jgi:hypothetical protein
VGVAGFRDRALLAPLAGGALGGHEPGEAHELLGRLEAGEVADLADDPERGQGVDPAQAAQLGDELRPRFPLGGLADLALERLDAAVDQVERREVVVEGVLLGREIERLLGKPGPAGHAPALGRHGAVVAQQELRLPVAGAHPVEAGVLAGAHQVARRLELPRRDPDRFEQATGVQTRQLPRIPRIGLDSLARPRGNEPRRHHLASNPASCQLAVEPKPVGPAS